MRGLKSEEVTDVEEVEEVAPYTGAWIEIKFESYLNDSGPVAPYTGAWIEISGSGCCKGPFLSHPTRVRGLKFGRNSCYFNS